DPTHLDSHQHVHRGEPARSALLAAARALGVPLRHFCPGVRHCGDFYGQTAGGEPFPEGIAVERLTAILAALPPGVTELACHPGAADGLASMYRAPRAVWRRCTARRGPSRSGRCATRACGGPWRGTESPSARSAACRRARPFARRGEARPADERTPAHLAPSIFRSAYAAAPRTA